MKKQITDSISKNLTDSDLESNIAVKDIYYCKMKIIKQMLHQFYENLDTNNKITLDDLTKKFQININLTLII